MNELTLTTTASQINAEHLLAIEHAGQAIDHAKKAGELLLAAIRKQRACWQTQRRCFAK